MQARWLRSWDHPGIVQVLSTRPEGYEMELLDDTPWGAVEFAEVAASVMPTLRDVWARPCPAEPDFPHFIWYVNQRGGRELVNWLSELAGSSSWKRECDTHGDPTIENTLRRDGKPVLVDPLPDPVIDGKIPSVRAVDLGKVLQSALGYELVKRGEREVWSVNDDVMNVVRAECADDDEWRLARFFCALHVRRLIPYQSDEHAQKWEAWWPQIAAFLHDS